MAESEYLTPHFKRSELRCPCCGKCEMHPVFMDALEKMRLDYNRPLRINSGYRCPEHNSKLSGSSPNSLHMKGIAADISWDEFPADDKKKLLNLAVKDFGGLGIGRTYLHVDLGPAKVWIY